MRGTVRWRGVELRHLEALAAVGEEGSFHRAAARLGYSQSAISQQVAALERAVGRRLIDRAGGSRTVAPTEAGLVLIAHAKAIGARLAAAEEDFALLESPTHGRLRVGAYRSAGSRVLSGALAELRRSYPDVHVELVQESSEIDLLRRLERGEVDVALVHLPILRGPFGFEPLPPDDYVLVMPEGAAPEVPSLAELASLPLLGLRECRSVENAYAYIRAAGHELELTPTADDALTLQRLVAAGLGAALLPRLALEAVPGTVVLELPPEMPRRASAVAWHRELDLRPAARAFVCAVVAAHARALADSTPERSFAPAVMASEITAA
jgi:DNA-binding transcriptional LysR family regulator